METKYNFHVGHRARIVDKFMENPSIMSDHEILEIILFRSLPRVNTNPLAHALIKTFGGLEGVFNADPKELVKIKGIGKKTAADLALLGQAMKRIAAKKKTKKVLSTVTDKNIEYVRGFFKEQGTEGFLVCMLSETFAILAELYYNSGMVHSVSGDVSELVDALSFHKPKFVLIAHSHLSGNVSPSKTDDRSTAKIYIMCAAHGATLIDHIIIADNKAFSYGKEGRLQHVKETCKFENMEF